MKKKLRPHASKHIPKIEKESKFAYHTKYKKMIGSLLYLATCRPNIMFNVYLYAKFQ